MLSKRYFAFLLMAALFISALQPLPVAAEIQEGTTSGNQFNNMAIGAESMAGISDGHAGYEGGNTAVGFSAKAQGQAMDDYSIEGWSTAVGYQAEATNNLSSAVGALAAAGGYGGASFGGAAEASGFYGAALGTMSSADGYYSVALGSFSKATDPYTVSVGDPDRQDSAGNVMPVYRRITNAAPGEDPNDVVIMSQLDGYVRYDTENVSIGRDSATKQINATAIGVEARAMSNFSTAIGFKAVAESQTPPMEGYSEPFGYLVAIGNQAEVTQDYSTGIGALVEATGYASSSVGSFAKANGDYGTAVGSFAEATGINSSAFGSSANASGWDGSAFGQKAVSSAVSATALGSWSEAKSESSVALGSYSIADEEKTVSVGNDTLKRRIVNVADGDIAEGSSDAVTGGQLYTTNQNIQTLSGSLDGYVRYDTTNFAIGENAQALSGQPTNNNMAIGRDAVAGIDNVGEDYFDAGGNTAIGFNAKAQGKTDDPESSVGWTTAIGYSAAATNNFSLAAGATAQATGYASTSVGTQAYAHGDYSSAFGMLAKATEKNSSAFGSWANAAGASSSAFGMYANASGSYSSAFGSNASTSEAHSTALGYNSQSSAANTTAIGSTAAASVEGASAIGTSAKASGSYSVALGSFSEASEQYTVSVGSETNGLKRRITNVAAGTDDNDAVNVSQLNELGGRVTAAEEKLNTLSGGAENAVQYDNGDKTLVTLNKDGEAATITNVADGRIEQGSKDAVTGGQLFTATQKIDGIKGEVDAITGRVEKTEASISQIGGDVDKLKGDVSTLDGRVTKTEEAISAIEGSVKNAVQYDGDAKDKITLAGGEGTVISNVADGVAAADAVNKGQLDAVQLQVDAHDAKFSEHEGRLGEHDATLKGQASLIAEQGTRLDGHDATIEEQGSLIAEHGTRLNEHDAAIDGQAVLIAEQGARLDEHDAAIGEYATNIENHENEFRTLQSVLGEGYSAPSFNSLRVGGIYSDGTNIDMGGGKITGLAPGRITSDSTDAVTGSQLWDAYRRMGDMQEAINVVGAHAAALSGLHPIQYNPYEPTTLSAAVGTYRDEYAVAVGVFHYVRENVLFNMGASICSDGDVMGRAGVSFAVGKGGKKKPELARDMAGMQQQMIAMQAKLEELAARDEAKDAAIKKLEDENAKMKKQLNTK